MRTLRFSVVFLILALCLITAADEETDEDDEENVEEKKVDGKLLRKSYPGETERNITAERAIFKKFVYRRHAERLQAVANVMKLNDYAKQYEMLDIVLGKMFEILLEHRVILESSGFIPGEEDWPLNMTVRDAMAHVIENTLFFGEIVLRMPDISRKVLSKNKEWESMITWTWAFSQQCLPYLHEKLHLPLNLMAQELGLIDKNEAFYNQFKLENQILEAPPESKSAEKKKKKPKEKGPRMSSASAGEL